MYNHLDAVAWEEVEVDGKNERGRLLRISCSVYLTQIRGLKLCCGKYLDQGRRAEPTATAVFQYLHLNLEPHPCQASDTTTDLHPQA